MYVWQLLQRLADAPAMSEVLIGIDAKWYHINDAECNTGGDLTASNEVFGIVAGELDHNDEE